MFTFPVQTARNEVVKSEGRCMFSVIGNRQFSKVVASVTWPLHQLAEDLSTYVSMHSLVHYFNFSDSETYGAMALCCGLICVSLMANDVAYFSKYLLAICLSSVIICLNLLSIYVFVILSYGSLYTSWTGVLHHTCPPLPSPDYSGLYLVPLRYYLSLNHTVLVTVAL